VFDFLVSAESRGSLTSHELRSAAAFLIEKGGKNALVGNSILQTLSMCLVLERELHRHVKILEKLGWYDESPFGSPTSSVALHSSEKDTDSIATVVGSRPAEVS
jgi:hypothetical protein